MNEKIELDIIKYIILNYLDESIIKNLKNTNKLFNSIISNNYKKIVYNILKNKYKCKIYEYIKYISVQNKKKCYSFIKNKDYLLNSLKYIQK